MAAARSALCTVALLLTAPVAFAHQSGASPHSGTQPQPPYNPVTVGANPEQSVLQKMADRQFVWHTMESDEAQIRLSRLAEQKSTIADVKQFSQRMVEVHAQFEAQLRPLAQRLGVSEPKGPSKREEQKIAKLQTLSGHAFDAAYLHVMAQEQQQSVKLFHDESEDTDNRALVGATRADIPAITQDLHTLRKIAQAHDVSLEK